MARKSRTSVQAAQAAQAEETKAVQDLTQPEPDVQASPAPVEEQKESPDLATMKVPDDDWETPTPEEWADEFKKYKSFRLPESDQNYTTGDYLFIMPNLSENQRVAKRAKRSDHSDDNPWWIGKVVEVRAKTVKSVFMIIHWMYTTIDQLADAGVARLPAGPLGNEIFASSHQEILPVHCVSDRACVHLYDETDVLAEYIDPSSLWIRSELSDPQSPNPIAERGTPTKKRKRKAGRKVKARPQGPTIKPMHPPSCVCKKAYQPVPLDHAPMVYCPTKGCQKWFHTACLDISRIAKPTAEQVESLVASGVDLYTPEVASEAPSAGDAKKATCKSIPGPITTAASMSILRGTTDTGIVGSGQKVIKARYIVNLSKTLNGEIEGNQEVQGAIKLWEVQFPEQDKKAKSARGKGGNHWACPACDAVI